ncbi:acetyl-CoA hydrolase/transferase family protein [Sedimentibacter sp. B4]|uniref:acetyl-CoA hydrolase/transferase family protein n=1 Tax=Sedimentibacter sp. B4 TaxID=304766 RepID=UPI00030C6C6E|nr:acetyl-CoA hydrolase/transferase C-terminal domain-containing protein [Sedimentibacter sp. B4]
MNRYKVEYESKLCSFEESYNLIQDGDVIGTGFAVMEPMGFLKDLHTISHRINKVTLLHSLDMGKYKILTDKEHNKKFHITSWFLMNSGRQALKANNIEYVPGNLHNAATRQIEVEPIDIFVATVTPMDEHGYFRFSLSNIGEHQWSQNAKKVILEVNPNLPNVYGDNEIHISQVDKIIECDRPIPILDSGEISEIDEKIGVNVASLVEDGSTIQLGIGAIPDAVSKAFKNKKDIGVHTEMITNSIVELVEAGVITGNKKTLHKGKIVGTFALGNNRLYNFMNNNPGVMILPGYYVNDPHVIAQNDNMVSINTAITVDFCGQVCSESINTKQYSGSGGQSDTATGAIHAKNGRSIIALRSTAKDDTVSTILPCLPLGSIVTLSRNNIDYIVTEYGIALMKNQSVKQRTINLINIAHPKFRDELRLQAEKLQYI